MSETWIEEKGWGKVKDRLPKEFTWKMQTAKRKNKKGRARGGMLLGVKKNIRVEEEGEEEEEGRMVCRIYAAALGERLKEEMETKEMLSESQAGFRKGTGTVDQIYALNYLINREIGKKGGKMTAVFIDLKAAFDSIERKILIRVMRKRGIREALVKRIEEIVRETKSRVKVGEY
ncbi:uncharacterized protein LOC115246303 [Formica exsecta]|uniref:uncharacterized protein LOC115246303 n=1 Tax=Formica exsecta TaxID=72781 RepID=UPI001141443A|nr:uncharacterized protein LOC115246303 [Formica exsecta]